MVNATSNHSTRDMVLWALLFCAIPAVLNLTPGDTIALKWVGLKIAVGVSALFVFAFWHWHFTDTRGPRVWRWLTLAIIIASVMWLLNLVVIA